MYLLFTFLCEFACISGAKAINDLGLWGNYSIPKGNPYVEDKELQPEIWAVGFRNPWRCSFDSERPSYFMCADVGQVCYLSLQINSHPVELYLILIATRPIRFGWITVDPNPIQSKNIQSDPITRWIISL